MFVNQYYEEATTRNTHDIISILTEYKYKERSKGAKWQDFSYEQYCYIDAVDADEENNDSNVNDIVFRYGIFYSSDFDAIIIPNPDKPEKNLKTVKNVVSYRKKQR